MKRSRRRSAEESDYGEEDDESFLSEYVSEDDDVQHKSPRSSGWAPSVDEKAQLVYWLRDLGEFVPATDWDVDAVARYLAIRIVDMHTRKDDFRPKQGVLMRLFRNVIQLDEHEAALLLRNWVAKVLQIDKRTLNNELGAVPNPKRIYAYSRVGKTPEERVKQLEAAIAFTPSRVQKQLARTKEWFQLLDTYIRSGDTSLLDFLLKHHPTIWVELVLVFGAERCEDKEKESLHTNLEARSQIQISTSGDKDAKEIKLDEGEHRDTANSKNDYGPTYADSGNFAKEEGDQVGNDKVNSVDLKLVKVLETCHPRARPGQGILPEDAESRFQQGLWSSLPEDIEAVSQFLQDYDETKLLFQGPREANTDSLETDIAALHPCTFQVLEGDFSFIPNEWALLESGFTSPILPPIVHWQRLSMGFTPSQGWWTAKAQQVSAALSQLDALDIGQPHLALLRFDRIEWLYAVLFSDEALGKEALAQDYCRRAVSKQHLIIMSSLLRADEVEPLFIKALRLRVPLTRVFPGGKKPRLFGVLFSLAEKIVHNLVQGNKKLSVMAYPLTAAVARLLDQGDTITKTNISELAESLARSIRNRIRKIRDRALVESIEERVARVVDWAEPTADPTFKYFTEGHLNKNKLVEFLLSQDRDLHLPKGTQNCKTVSSARKTRTRASRQADTNSENQADDFSIPAIWAGLEAIESSEDLQPQSEITGIALTDHFRVLEIVQPLRNEGMPSEKSITYRKYPSFVQHRDCLVLEEIKHLESMLGA